MASKSSKRKTGVPRKRVMSAPPELPALGGGSGREVLGTLFFVFGLFLLAALYSHVAGLGYLPSLGGIVGAESAPESRLMGPIGSTVGRWLFLALGWCALLIPLWITLVGYRLWTGEGQIIPAESSVSNALLISLFWSFVTLSSVGVLLAIFFGSEAGGYIGFKLGAQLSRYIGDLGTVLLAVPLFLVALGVSTGLGPLGVLSLSGSLTRLFKVALIDSTIQVSRVLGPRMRESFAEDGGAARFFQTLSRWALLGLILPVKLVKKLLLAPLQPLEGVNWSFRGKALTRADVDEEEVDEEAEPSARAAKLRRKKRALKRSREAGAPSEPLRKRLDEKLSFDDADFFDEPSKLSAIAPPTPPIINRGELKNESQKTENRELAEADEGPEGTNKESRVARLRKRGAKLRKGLKKRRARAEQGDDASDEADSGEDDSGEDDSLGLNDEADLPEEKEFELPSLELLVAGGASYRGPKDDELLRNSNLLEKTLSDFRIGGKIVEVQPGPVITLYEFAPAAGVKVQRIISLSDDLALALKVASVRVYAPVPGKGTVGIEVPNADREIVRLRDILSSDEFQSSESGLTLALGKDTFGTPVAADLSRMPHLLIAGATGTGKSVCINSLLLSLLYRNTPEQLRFIMIDPKMLELSLYEEIPHLLAPVVTNPKRARGVLWWAVEEMERRYRVMKDVGVRNLASYNRYASGDESESSRAPNRATQVIELKEEDVVAAATQALEEAGLDRDGVSLPEQQTLTYGTRQLEPMPRIVIVVDEMADLMLTVGKEVEELFTRLAQKARAAGIHLILATQRPSVNVITGLIKANFPARVSFQVASKIDARTVLDHSGAEKLLGQGDMLFLSAGTGRVRRLHSPFVSDKEVQTVVELLKKQGAPQYEHQIEQMVKRLDEAEKGSSGAGEEMNEEVDPLYDQAVNLVIEKGFASTSMVQRVFRIGYNRAARILETMEREGVVGPADGAKPRHVYGALPADLE